MADARPHLPLSAISQRVQDAARGISSNLHTRFEELRPGHQRRQQQQTGDQPWHVAVGDWLKGRQRDGDRFRNFCASEMDKHRENAVHHVLAGISSLQARHVAPSPSFASVTSTLHAFTGPAAAQAASVQSDGQSDGPRHLFDVAMSAPQVAKRLEGLAVYTVSNANNEFVLITDSEGDKSIGLFCFRKEDAETMLAQVKDRDPSLGRGARVVPVTMDKVYQLSTEGIAFRFLPDPTQVKNALQLRSLAGDNSKGFDGVPVFQSESLILRNKAKRFCPIFFSKEDLDSAVQKATGGKQQKGGAQVTVGSFEDVLKKMESHDELSPWADLLFIPAGRELEGVVGKAIAGTGSQSTVYA